MHLLGLYKIPSFAVEFDAVFTNRMFCCPYRGAGRPYAAFVIERMIDRIARELDLDPAEVRRRNLIQPSDMPFRYPVPYWDGGPVEFDSGDYPNMLREALALIDYDGIKADQPRLRQSGRHVGVAVAVYSEITGIGPYEGARVHVRPDGHVIVASGVGSQGQGQCTTLTQIVADELGVPPGQVEVTLGDTASFEWGIGTFASRSAVTAGNAVRLACLRVAEQAKQWASERLEASIEDLELADGMVRVKGVSGHGIPLGEIAAGANPARGRIIQDPASFRPGLQAEGFFNPAQGTMGAGVHACTVEVDVEVATVKILRYVVVHECGHVINPQIVEGQITGGVALGVGGAFYERLVYDDTGQLLTATYMDYLIPTAAEIPAIEVVHHDSASLHNPLGVKGVGEAGTIPVAALFAAAVEDALKPLDVHLDAMPIDGPSAVWQAIREASRTSR
jgi:CO/xanthine dehydrogenase Mo-binding subunit